jgi:Zn-dependent protease with chaperone function
MRARERARVEHLVRELLSESDPALASRLCIYWARALPDVFALAWINPSPRILMCETAWDALDAQSRADLAAHEAAHILTDERTPEKQTHGPRWKKNYRKLLSLALEMEWC